jgi:predicted methyltransferase MtxX (methanogen marker protein 4)
MTQPISSRELSRSGDNYGKESVRYGEYHLIPAGLQANRCFRSLPYSGEVRSFGAVYGVE